MKKTTIACCIAAFSLTACVQNPVLPDSSYESPFQSNRLININGIAAYSGGRFDLGLFGHLPRARTADDLSALSRLVQAYRAVSLKEARGGDYEAAMVANHLAAQFADYQASLAHSSRDAIRSMIANGNGNVDLAPGAYAILPAFDRYEESPARYSFNDWPYGQAHEVAANDLDTKLDTANNILNAIVGRPARNPAPRANTLLNPSQALSLPLNQPVTLTSGAVLERTKDSFILHNPGGAPLKVDVQQLGYLPPIRTPSRARMIAGQILAEMNRSLVEPVMAGAVQETNVEPPNKILFTVNGVQRPGGLSSEGRLAATPEEVKASKREYENAGSPFRLAVDARYGMERSRERNEFRAQCFAMGRNTVNGYTFVDRLKGSFGEIVDLRCVRKRYQGDSDGELIYSRRYYVTDSGQVKSWESLMRDQDTVKRLGDLDRSNEAIESIVQLLPFIGNAESGLKCADASTMTQRLRTRFDGGVAALGQQRSFVSDIYSMNAGYSGIDRAADCASALPLIGNAAKLGMKAAQLASFGKYVDAYGKPFAAAMNFFDNGVKSGRSWGEVAAKLPGQSATATSYAKTAYDTMQNGKSLSDLLGSVSALAG